MMSAADAAARHTLGFAALGASPSSNGMHSRSEGTGEEDHWLLLSQTQHAIHWSGESFSISIRQERHDTSGAERCVIYGRRLESQGQRSGNTPHLTATYLPSRNAAFVMRPSMSQAKRRILHHWAHACMNWARVKTSVAIGLATSDDIPVCFLRACSQVARIKELDEKDLDQTAVMDDDAGASSTTALAVQKARVGQGLFRDLVLAQWGWACAVTRCRLPALLVAGHIKPWATAGITDAERLDPFNGLPLVPSLAAAFDRGFLTFAADGQAVVSKKLDIATRSALGVTAGMRLAVQPASRMADYLTYHRQHVFQDAK